MLVLCRFKQKRAFLISQPHRVVKKSVSQTRTQMLNKLKNFRSLGPVAIPGSLAPKGNQANISVGVFCFLSSYQQSFTGCCTSWCRQHQIKQPKTYKTMFMIVLKLLKVEGCKIRASSDGSRPKTWDKITIKLANI